MLKKVINFIFLKGYTRLVVVSIVTILLLIALVTGGILFAIDKVNAALSTIEPEELQLGDIDHFNIEGFEQIKELLNK